MDEKTMQRVHPQTRVRSAGEGMPLPMPCRSEGATQLALRKQLMQRGGVQMALFGKAWTRNRVRVIDVEFCERNQEVRYELRRYPGETVWVLMEITRREKLINVLGNRFQYKTVTAEKELWQGTLADMRRMADALTPEDQSA